MKKIIAVLLAVMLIFTFASCKKVDSSKPVITDANGNPIDYETRINANGEVEYYVTNADGSVSLIDPNNVATTLNMEEYAEVMDYLENPDLLVEEDSGNNDFAISDEAIPEDAFQEEKVEVDSNGKPVRDGAVTDYMSLIEGEEFTIEMIFKGTMDGEEMSMPVYITKNADGAYMEVSAPAEEYGGYVKSGMLIKNEKAYMVIPGMKSYIEIGEGDLKSMGEMFDPEQYTGSADIEEKYVSSATVEIDGKTYSVDIYDMEGSTMKYFYAEDGSLTRMEETSEEGSTIIEFKTLSDKAETGKIKLPTGYINLTPLLQSGDGFSSLFG